MTHRDFDDSSVQESHDKGLTFTLAGEEFETLPQIPAEALNAISTAVTTDRKGRQVFNAVDIIAFFEMVLVDRKWVEDPEAEDGGGKWERADDVDRFKAICASKTVIVPLEKLGEIFEWVMEELTERPTSPPAR